MIWNSQIEMPKINWLFTTKLNYCLLFHFCLCSVLLFSHYTHANLLTYQMFLNININLLSVLIYLINITLMKFQLCRCKRFSITCFRKILPPLVKRLSFCNKKLLSSIFPMFTTLLHIYEHAHKCIAYNIKVTSTFTFSVTNWSDITTLAEMVAYISASWSQFSGRKAKNTSNDYFWVACKNSCKRHYCIRVSIVVKKWERKMKLLIGNTSANYDTDFFIVSTLVSRRRKDTLYKLVELRF